MSFFFEKGEKDIMKGKPRNPHEPLFDKLLFQEILISGLIIGVVVFIVWYYLINIIGMEVGLARGYIMALMVFVQNVHVFNCRSEKKSAFTISLASNKLIVGGVICSIILQIIIMEVHLFASFLGTSSIPLLHLVYLLLLAMVVLVVMEIYKKMCCKRHIFFFTSCLSNIS